MRRIAFLDRLLDLLFPRACNICGSRLTVTEQVICGPCNMHMPRTHYERSFEDNDLVRLFWAIIPIERGVAWFYYKSHSPAVRPIYRLKYGNRPHIGLQLGEMYAHEIQDSGFFDGIDIILPVPLTRKRERKRGYNQTMMIARGVGYATGLPIATKALTRSRFKESQTHKNMWERRDNVEGVFKLKDADSIRGKHVLIVDDVVTTGSTIIACAKELLKAGDVRISILALGHANPRAL